MKERGRKEKPFSSFFFSSTLRSPHSSSHTHTFISPMKSTEPMERKLMSSAAAGSVLAVTSLLKDNPDLHANCKDIDGRSPLHLASEWGNLGVVHLLLAHPGIEVNSLSSRRETPFRGEWGVVELLIASGRDLGNLSEKGLWKGKDSTALEIARERELSSSQQVASFLTGFMKNPARV